MLGEISLISFLVPFLMGAVITVPFFIWRLGTHRAQSASLHQQILNYEKQLASKEQEQTNTQAHILRLHGQTQESQARLSEVQKQLSEAQTSAIKQEEEVASLNHYTKELELELSESRTIMSQKQQAFEAQLAHLEEAKQTLKNEFEVLANQILEEKSQRFSNQNQTTINQLLQPVQSELKGFKEKMESIHLEDVKQRTALKSELLHLQANSKAMTEQADKLTSALQGQKKVQGNWGELMLENVLDSAGLRAGFDYQREVSISSESGTFRPDVVVYLPQSRHLIIDAKTSLNAYTRYVNAETELEAGHAIVEHVNAVAARIQELGNKQYEKLPGLNSPEVVIMFVPIESAFVEAVKHAPTLYQQALQHNVLVATPTTLLTSLNIVKQLWRFEDQSKHTKELAERAERFYTKLNGFLHSMEGVGRQLDKAKESYEKAFSQLYHGKGNLIKQASEFKELGVSVKKEISQELQEKAKLELE